MLLDKVTDTYDTLKEMFESICREVGTPDSNRPPPVDIMSSCLMSDRK